MNNYEKQYLEIMQDILDNGIESENRTGINTLSVFKRDMRFDLAEGFPILTTKRCFFRGAFEELQLFLRGETNTKILEQKGVNYWKGNTSREFLNNKKLYELDEGDLGCGYSHQLRNFGGTHLQISETYYDSITCTKIKGFDQLKYVIKLLKEDPTNRRIIISFWNPFQMQYMALPPCHLYYQWIARPQTKELYGFYLLRSSDWFLGKPQNDIMTGLLTHYLAKLIGYTAKEISVSSIDTHIYTNHIEQCKLQLSRTPKTLPKLVIKKDLRRLDDILDLEFDDIELDGYKPDKTIKGEMAV